MQPIHYNKQITIACHPDEGGNYVLELNFEFNDRELSFHAKKQNGKE